MNSRFKFLSSVDPNAVPPNQQIKSRFNKLTLSTTTTSKMETKETTIRKEAITTAVATTTTTTIVSRSSNVETAIPRPNGSRELTATNSGQKPKILMYESTVTSKSETSMNEHSIEVLTDDDTNSVGSSIDADFVHAIDTTDDLQTKAAECVGTQLANLSISSSQRTSQQTTQDNIAVNLHNLSYQFGGMGLGRKAGTVAETLKTESQEPLEDTVQNNSALTLSSTDSVHEDNQSKMTEDSRRSSIIVLSDSEDESNNQPPLRVIPRTMEDYNVSSSLASEAVANLPNSSLMHKINKFFDCVPSLNVSTTSTEHLDKTQEPENESLYVSETTCGDDNSDTASNSNNDPKSSVPDDTEANNGSPERSSPSIVPETCADESEDELAGVNEMKNVPVTKSSSDQARPVAKTASGIKLRTTNSTPIIESTVHDADGVKRSNSNNVAATLKNTGSSIKFNTGSNGQLNIAAKININIQISNHDTSTSDDSSSESSSRDEASLETPAIESEPIRETEEIPSNESNSGHSTNSLSATQAKSVASSPEQYLKAPKARLDLGHNTPKTPSGIDRVKKFEFVAPKSMTKANPSSYVTPKRNKENELPDKLADGFVVDKLIGVDPKDQLLLHQVYGDAWKTPEVLRTYSAVKGRPVATGPMRQIQSAKVPHHSRVSRGFNLFKRNIADDLDSTRWDELSVIEGPAEEISPLKNPNVPELETVSKDKKLKPQPRKEPSMIAEEPEGTSPPVTPKRKNVEKSFLGTSDEDDGEIRKECPPPPPPTTAKKNVRSKRVQEVKESPARGSESLLHRDKKKFTPIERKRNPPRTPAQIARDRLRNICDSDSGSGDDKDAFMTSDEDDDWDAAKDASSSTSSSSSDDDYKPSTSKKRGQPVGTSSTTKKKTASKARTNARNLVYLDLSAEEVVEVDENHQTKNVSEEDLAEITRKFLASDLNDSTEEKKSTKPLRRKLFTPNYDALEDDSQFKDIFQTDKRTATPINKPNVNDEVKLKIPIPIFTSLTHKLIDSRGFATPKTPAPRDKSGNRHEPSYTPKDDPFSATKDTTYSFLKSLDVITSMRLCHPDAVKYRKNFNANKEELTEILYKLYNEKVFDGKLNTPITWNKKLLTTAGRCHNSTRGGRSARIELSTKVITSSDRLRCTLIHEMCHAAVWLFHGVHDGHGVKWRSWANRSNQVFPELPIIGRCHNYDIEYKYTYQCDLCHSKSFSHSKSKKVENIRCSCCHGSISIYLNKKQKDGTVVPTPVREASGFAKFVKEKYKEFKEPGIKHAEVMRLISAAFGSLSVEEKKKY